MIIAILPQNTQDIKLGGGRRNILLQCFVGILRYLTAHEPKAKIHLRLCIATRISRLSKIEGFKYRVSNDEEPQEKDNARAATFASV